MRSKIIFTITVILVISITILYKSPIKSTESNIKLENVEFSKGVFLIGDRITAEVTIKNKYSKNLNLWIGYSLQDGNKKWYDVPAKRVNIKPNKKIDEKLVFEVPEKIISGKYRVVVALWNKSPDENDAIRLDSKETNEGIMIYNFHDDFNTLNMDFWNINESKLGRSLLKYDNVFIEDSKLKIKISKNTLNGGEIRTKKLLSYGSYEIKMKVPNVPSSITGLFLYKQPDFYNEIDIEIFNDSKGKFLLTTYYDGSKSNEYIGDLEKDLTEEFYKYRIDYYKDSVSFYIDDILINSWNKNFTHEPMYLMVNGWFPNWLDGLSKEEDEYIEIDSIRY